MNFIGKTGRLLRSLYSFSKLPLLIDCAALLAQTQPLNADSMMPKPFTYEDVMDVVERWVG